jgi:hypothetical protein
MPTFPELSIRIASEPPSENAIVSAAGKNIPVFVSPVGEIAGAEALPDGIAKVFDTTKGDATVILDA